MRDQPIRPIEIVQRLKAGVPAEVEEMLWFLQYESMQPGGLDRLAKDLVARFPERVGPTAVREAAGRKKLSQGEAIAFWREVPHRFKGELAGIIPDAWILDASDEASVCDLLGVDPDRERRRERSKGFPEVDLLALRRVLAEHAPVEVCSSLAEFCQLEGELSCWIFPLVESLRDWMRERADLAMKRIAETAVVKRVFDALDFAWEAKVMVQIEGDPRHGKTEAIAAYCGMHRGRTRLISVPSENSEADFFVAIAEGMGIDVQNPGNVAAIRREIDFILAHSRLMLIWDEAHWLLPQRYSETTPPSRMNWLRTRVADRGLPTALIITPQSFDGAFRKFIRKTNYRFEQFFGRVAKFTLPEVLSREDVIAVARIHFPEIPLPYLKMIAGRAMQCAGYLQAVEFTARRARHLAKKAGREGRILEEDIEQAMAEMMPGKPAADRQQGACKPAPASPRETVRREPEEEILSESQSRTGATLLVA